MAALWRGVPVLLLMTCALTQVRSQVFVTERRQTGVSRHSVLEELDTKREEADPFRRAVAGGDGSAAGTSHSRPQAGRPDPGADQALLSRIAKLELLDAKLSQMDVLEKVFHFVQLDSNMARISTQVDRLAERLHDRAPANCASADSEVIQQLATLGGRLIGVEKMMEGVTANVKNQLGHLDSQLDLLHSQLDALLERNVQLNTKTEIMREAVAQLLVASEVVDDQLEQADHNLGYLRDELDWVKQKTHDIHHQQHKSEEAIKEVTLAAQQKIDDQVQRVEKTLQQRLNLMTIDLSLISSTIWRAENETRFQDAAEPFDYLDEVLTSPLEDAAFRAKFVNEIRSAVLEDSKRIIGSGCRRKESHSPEILKTRLVQDVQSAINSSLERIVAAQWMPSDCSDVHRQSTDSGLFAIYPNACSRGHKMQVYCDMETTGGGWTVIQRRGEYPGRRSVDFYNDWNTYKWGFGNVSEEFYLGNELIHLLTTSDDFVLRVELEDFSGDRRYAEYQHFSIDGDTEQYRLNVGQYSGNAGDAMTYHNGLGFTTKDEEHDTWPGKNCATHYRGGWWFGACHKVNLNGAYLSGSHGSYGNGIIWYPWRGYYYSLRSTRMMVRPRRVHEMSPTMRP